jgi:hypothetical protein
MDGRGLEIDESTLVLTTCPTSKVTMRKPNPGGKKKKRAVHTASKLQEAPVQ